MKTENSTRTMKKIMTMNSLMKPKKKLINNLQNSFMDLKKEFTRKFNKFLSLIDVWFSKQQIKILTNINNNLKVFITKIDAEREKQFHNFIVINVPEQWFPISF